MLEALMRTVMIIAVVLFDAWLIIVIVLLESVPSLPAPIARILPTTIWFFAGIVGLVLILRLLVPLVHI